MNVIALTGGIAAGKSTVAGLLADRGAQVIDADALARAAVEPGTPGLASVRSRFGDEIVRADGTLDRAALGAIVFGDAAARADLNAIVHPEVGRLYRERLSQLERTMPEAIVVYDVPLLVEARSVDEFELVVVVHAPAELRVQRLVELRGITPDEARRRVDAQASDEQRLAIADVVIDTSGSLESTIEQVEALWQRLVAERPPRTGVSDPLS
ncbi:MAG: dephospho-CoA kinase, long form [Microcella sp.]|uniref:dephospho-CoA kinase n=1 Tax=Microcella sp. TaxID=1913979 RepID=UPI0024C56C12|nr:dephospho-CoA kinase [Microcella sp.]UYN84251.1 MAG: dephospho-CoA kinase, long form [Microcella sp.]